jgi:hypothetical protein
MTAFAPFIIGRHSCIGVKVAYNEMRLIVARLLWRFDLKLKDERDRWDWGEQCTYLLWVSFVKITKSTAPSANNDVGQKATRGYFGQSR